MQRQKHNGKTNLIVSCTNKLSGPTWNRESEFGAVKISCRKSDRIRYTWSGNLVTEN